MSARRLPVDEALIPPRHLQAIKQALRANATVELNGIAIHPPTGSRGTWRVKTHLNGRPVERSGGRTIGQLYAAFLAVAEAREHTPVLTGERPALEHVKLMAALDRYIAAGGKDGKWGDSSRQQSKAAFTTLREMFGARRCADITDAMLREALSASSGTHSTGRTRWGRYATFLEWGMTQGYFTEWQSTAMGRVQWAPPVGSTYRRAATRRDQAKQHFPPAGLAVGGNVMTHEQVGQFAAACQERYAHGSLLIFASADLGTRSAETRLFTADPAVMAAGLGNYVDLEAEVVRIRFQAGSERGKGAHLPKADRQRDVVIPSDGNGANKHATLSALRARAEQARAEQARGENPLALYFPTSIGTVLDENNLRERVWGPAADALGWRMPDYQTAKGRTRAMRRFTLHSLRDFFATMAINEWHYTEESLLWQGAWTDLKVVRASYSGTTDDTHAKVRRLHGKVA